MANGASERPASEARLDERWQRAPAEARREERAQRPPREAMAQDRQVRQERRQTSSHALEPEDDGFLSGARRLTNRAFDALDGMFRKDRDERLHAAVFYSRKIAEAPPILCRRMR